MSLAARIPDAVMDRAKDLLLAINHDENANGGLLSRETIRKGDELRIAIANMERQVRVGLGTMETIR